MQDSLERRISTPRNISRSALLPERIGSSVTQICLGHDVRSATEPRPGKAAPVEVAMVSLQDRGEGGHLGHVKETHHANFFSFTSTYIPKVE